MNQTFRSAIQLFLIIVSQFIFGCGVKEPASEQVDAKEDPPIPTAPASLEEAGLTISELQLMLKEKNPSYTGKGEFRKAGGEIRIAVLFQAGLSDISPLAGLPLKQLDLTGNPVSDLRALKGMPLQELYLENTKVTDLQMLKGMPLKILRMEHTAVSDISPLAGMKLQQLNLFDTKVESIDAVEEMPLHTLWLQATKVSDLGPLAGKYLESLDVKDSPVSDLSVLTGMISLKRLNIAGSAITDLTPLKGTKLDRLIFTSAKIEKGIDVVREMQSLQKIGASFDAVMSPAQFWPKYDAGEF